LRKAGLTYRCIAEKFDVAPHQIRHFCRNAGREHLFPAQKETLSQLPTVAVTELRNCYADMDATTVVTVNYQPRFVLVPIELYEVPHETAR